MSITTVNTVTAPRDVLVTESISLKTIRPVQANRAVTKGDEDDVQISQVARPTATSPDRRELDPTMLAKVRRRENFQFATLCVPLFLAGYNDGSIFKKRFSKRNSNLLYRLDWSTSSYNAKNLRCTVMRILYLNIQSIWFR